MKTHRTTKAIGAALLVLPVLLATAIAQNTSAIEDAALTNGVRWHLSTEKSQYLPGEKMIVQVVFSNVGTNVLVLAVGRPISDGEIRVTTAEYTALLTQHGKKLMKQESPPPASTGRLDLSSSRRPLAPGESLTNSFYLNRLFDMTMTNQYSVTASRRVWTKPDTTNFFTVKTNPLVITVVEEQ